MAKYSENLTQHCLYFTSNALARTMTRMAEEEFARVGLAPSHAFLLMRVLDEPGRGQKDLAGDLQLAQSTVSRFVAALESRGLVRVVHDGRTASVHATAEGSALVPEMQAAWKRLHERYSATLGRKKGDDLAKWLGEVAKKLDG